MEEVDNIIIHSLRQIGCAIDEDTNSLVKFSSELVVEAAVKCLKIIQPGVDLPNSLPTNMALRFKVTASIAEACTELGYRGDIGYQTFLYSNEADIRRIFIFLIEHLPKESDKNIVNIPQGRVAILEQKISRIVAQQLSAPWLPKYCKKDGIRKLPEDIISVEGRSTLKLSPSIFISVPQAHLNDVTQGLRDYWVNILPSVPEQTKPDTLVQSIIAYNSVKALQHLLPFHLDDNSHTTYISKYFENVKDKSVLTPSSENLIISDVLNAKADESNEVVSKSESFTQMQTIISSKVKSIEELLTETENLKSDIEIINNEIKLTTDELNKINESNKTEELAIKNAIEKYKTTSRNYALLENSDENLEKLQAMIDASVAKMVTLQKQWDEHKEIWTAKYQEAKKISTNKVSGMQQMETSIKMFKERNKDLSEQLQSKSVQHQQLTKEMETANKKVTRSSYTRRIMEIIGNIGKQKTDLQKVLNDTRGLQKEINTLTGQLERSFTVADELIFKDARRDNCSRHAYKLLATLHSDCSLLVSTVEATGTAVREARDLEEQLQSEQSKKIPDSLERVQRDLDSMKQDSAQLIQKIKEVNNLR